MSRIGSACTPRASWRRLVMAPGPAVLAPVELVKWRSRLVVEMAWMRSAATVTGSPGTVVRRAG
jgi:hypothetical protein